MILVKSKEVNKSNKNEVWNILFGQNFSEYPLPKFKVGDTVRILKYKSTFTIGPFALQKIFATSAQRVCLVQMNFAV